MSPEARLPTFLVIGAQRAGTTALYDHLRQHPQIFMSPVKEPHFFALEGWQPPRGAARGARRPVTTLEAYRELFREASDERALGEASTLYLPSPDAAQRIRHHTPDVRLVALLRDPAERAWSAFLHQVRDGREPLEDFAAALAAEPRRVEAGWLQTHWGWLWRYRELGYYHRQLAAYLQVFPRAQLRIYLYEDFSASPIRLLSDLFSFLGVDEEFVPDMTVRPNPSGRWRSATAGRILRKGGPVRSVLRRALPRGARWTLRNRAYGRLLEKHPMPPEARADLQAGYRDDIRRLQDLLQRDLSSWLR